MNWQFVQWGRAPELAPLLDAPAEELRETDAPRDTDALAAEKPPELPPPMRPVEKPERGAEGGATEREAVEKLRAGAAVERAPGFATRIADVDAGTAPRMPAGEAVIAPTRALVAAGALEFRKRREEASNASVDLPPTLRIPPFIVRSKRAGAVVFIVRVLIVFLGIDFTDFHC